MTIQSQQIQVNRQQFDFNLKITEYSNQVQIEKYFQLLEKSIKIQRLKESVAQRYQIQYNQGTLTISALLLKLQEATNAQQEVRSNKLYHLKAIYDYNHTTGKH